VYLSDIFLPDEGSSAVRSSQSGLGSVASLRFAEINLIASCLPHLCPTN